MELWPILLLLLVLVIYLTLPWVSPCTGCVVASEGRAEGDLDCRNDCEAYREYQEKSGRRK